MNQQGALTDLIRLAQQGDEAAIRSVFSVTYQDLRILARARLNRSGRGTLLDTTSLVHESFIRLADAAHVEIEHRQHFMRYASHVMRSVVVDLVRERMAERRGGGRPHITLATDIGAGAPAGAAEVLQVHEALDDLDRFDRRLRQVVEMRYFAGMTESEIARALGVTERTVQRDWRKARVLLAESLRQ